MNPNTIRWLDRNIGRPVCFLLTLQRKISSFFKSKKPYLQKCDKILFIKLIEQGSTVLAYPALKKAAGLVGQDNIYFMVFKENRPILDILDIVPQNNIFEIDSRNIFTLIFSLFKVLRRLYKEKIDAVIDMEFFSRGSAIISYLAGAKTRVGLHQFTCEGPYRGDLFTHKLIYNPYLHTKVFFASLVEALNHIPKQNNGLMIFEVPEIKEELPLFLPEPQEREALRKKVEGIKQASLTKPVIILNPSVSDILPIRRWPEEHFIELGRIILRGFPQATIIITGTSKEKEKAEAIVSKIGNAVSLAGHTSIRELLTLYSIADILVTNDSGPAHFSALTSIKSIILFGPETPLLYGELSKNIKNITPDLICSPCINVYNFRESPCHSRICLKNISPAKVLEKIKDAVTS
ncbi:MAG: hypothetical protein DRP74_05215 [Candidatus Omnitrophota bacterium]|nr:MAG: hypothetical protein DRP74_05215 [Candidatus Omnitrophota bacterium]